VVDIWDGLKWAAVDGPTRQYVVCFVFSVQNTDYWQIHGYFDKFVKETHGAKRPVVEQNGTAKTSDDKPKPTFNPIKRRMNIPA